MSPQIKQK
uniref:Uncharacterized protein n=1 Tax=Anguilla anguilla TaxID=7936 RepID=A0A0E9UVI9_ANGAN